MLPLCATLFQVMKFQLHFETAISRRIWVLLLRVGYPGSIRITPDCQISTAPIGDEEALTFKTDCLEVTM